MPHPQSSGPQLAGLADIAAPHSAGPEASAPALLPGLAEVRFVKRSASRSVFRAKLDGQDVYVKQFHRRSVLQRLARWLGRSSARSEMAFSRYLQSRGVPAVEFLRIGSTGGREWVITRAVHPAQTASAWHARQRQAMDGGSQIRLATGELARLVGRMHAAGVLHRDLHCGNLLVRTDGERPRLVLADLHRASRHLLLARSARARNLAQLLHDRLPTTSRTDRLRFLREYLAASGARGTLRGWVLLVEAFATEHTRRQHARLDRRILRDNRYFARIALGGGWKAHVVCHVRRQAASSSAAGATFTPEQWREVLADPAALLSGPQAEVVKDCRSGLVIRRRLVVGHREVDVYIKRPRIKPGKAILDCLRESRPVHAFRLGHEMLIRRIDTALPLAALERRRGPFLKDSILITEAVDACHLNAFLSKRLGPADAGVARQVLGQLGRLLREMHHRGYAHRDLKASNLLVHWQAGQRPQLVLIDLDGLRRWPILTQKRKWQGLMRLNVSLLECPAVTRAGRLRLLLGYLRRPGRPGRLYKGHWLALEEWSARKIRRQIRTRQQSQKAVRRPAP